MYSEMGFEIIKSAGTLFYCEETNRYGLGRRGLGVRHPNTWGPVGGIIDVGEISSETVIREVKEEIGMTLDQYKLKKIDHHIHSEGIYTLYIYPVEKEFIPLLLQIDEVSEFKWFLWDGLDNLHPGLKRSLNKIGKYL
tara:strand:+ start:2896 stop:3309 length:414 start_codon:yes stop_codon:yes gene_type:complete